MSTSVENTDEPREVEMLGGTRIYFNDVHEVPLGCLIRKGQNISCRHFGMTSVDITLPDTFPKKAVDYVAELRENGTLEEKLAATKQAQQSALVIIEFCS